MFLCYTIDADMWFYSIPLNTALSHFILHYVWYNAILF